MGLILDAMSAEDRADLLEAQRAVAAPRKTTKASKNAVPKGEQFAESLREGSSGSSVPTGDAFVNAIRG